MINARSETAAEKPSFRAAMKRRRCLIAADGFYEWKSAGPKQPKQPFYIHQPDESPFAFAGLWETWQSKDRAGPVIESCTILTTSANGMMRPLHDRMPVIVACHDYDAWLDTERWTPDDVHELLAPAPKNCSSPNR